jgi:hypothetical protein
VFQKFLKHYCEVQMDGAETCIERRFVSLCGDFLKFCPEQGWFSVVVREGWTQIEPSHVVGLSRGLQSTWQAEAAMLECCARLTKGNELWGRLRERAHELRRISTELDDDYVFPFIPSNVKDRPHSSSRRVNWSSSSMMTTCWAEPGTPNFYTRTELNNAAGPDDSRRVSDMPSR